MSAGWERQQLRRVVGVGRSYGGGGMSAPAWIGTEVGGWPVMIITSTLHFTPLCVLMASARPKRFCSQ